MPSDAYCNRRNTSIHIMSLGSHFIISRVFSDADIILLTFKSSGIVEITAQKDNWEYKVI